MSNLTLILHITNFCINLKRYRIGVYNNKGSGGEIIVINMDYITIFSNFTNLYHINFSDHKISLYVTKE